MIECNFNCFECEFPDCILDTDSSNSHLDEAISCEIDSFLFPVNASVPPAVPDYRFYDFIPSEDIPYNPKWKSQAKWREYFRSKMRGNRKTYLKFYSQKYRQEHREEILLRDRKYYQEHKEERLKYSHEYYQEYKEEIITKQNEYRQKNKEKLAARRKELYQMRKRALEPLRVFYDALWKIL